MNSLNSSIGDPKRNLCQVLDSLNPCYSQKITINDLVGFRAKPIRVGARLQTW